MKKKRNYRLDKPIFLDYEANNISSIRVSHTEMLETIKERFEKDGFKKTGETYKGFTILRKTPKRGGK